MSDDKFRALVALIENDEGAGVYPCGHLTDKQRKSLKGSDGYKCGWNDAHIEQSMRVGKLISQASAGLSDDMTMLLASGRAMIGEDGNLSLNMNDIWGWALAWFPEVAADQLSAVADLFKRYGDAGLMYWHSCQEKDMRSEFHDNNRAIDFVRKEEAIRKETPDSSARAYRKVSYLLGDFANDATETA